VEKYLRHERPKNFAEILIAIKNVGCWRKNIFAECWGDMSKATNVILFFVELYMTFLLSPFFIFVLISW
jgi:hypothetical protein